MPSRTLCLVCNAHIDPVWLWPWEEGLAETLTTFRTAAQLCQEFDGFVFNHNEALLYQWVEDYEPELFETIRRLVEKGRWHIMGGWYLQPDCNLPSGESLVRQILAGKRYFRDKFNVEPKTAANLDSFGHSRGLVQILKKAGYSSYLFCRPDGKNLHLPQDDFIWIGYDGSEILAHRSTDHYNSERGKAGEKIEKWLARNKDQQTGLLLWGIGDHGGGPSREDLRQIETIRAKDTGWNIQHGRPEDYFERLGSENHSLPRWSGDLNPWAVGCYTSMAGVKQRHRLLENTYFSTEKMLANAALQGLINHPHDQLRQALEDLLFCQFHDVLPGSSIAEVEAYALQRMDHGLEILSRLQAKAFFRLLSGQAPAEQGEFPIVIYNPHPFDLDEIAVCELQPLEPNLDRGQFLQPIIRDDAGQTVPFQLEKESSNVAVDQRKRVVFRAQLKAASMNRFSCTLKKSAAISKKAIGVNADFNFASDACSVIINPETGLMDLYRVGGIDYLHPGSFKPVVIRDYPDPWGMKVRSFRNIEGEFRLMDEEESAEFAAVSSSRLAPVRIIEDGPIRTTVEALLKYGRSALCLRYKIPKMGSEIEIEIRVYWMEKDRMLKLSIPSCFEAGRCLGQVAYGVQEFDRSGVELAAQKWIGLISADRECALTVINAGTYGFDFDGGELHLSLLRSPAYSGHPVGDGIPIVPQDRLEPRIDQGERLFRFWLNAGPAQDRLARIDREALAKNEPPMVLCCYPSGRGEKPLPGVTLSDPVVQLTALKMAEADNRLIVRLFEPTGTARQTRLRIPFLNIEHDISLQGFEIKTMAVDLSSKVCFEVDLLERKFQ